MVAVDGATRLYGIVGHPIAQAGSPRRFTERFAAAGMNAVMVPMDVLPERFDDTVRGIMALANLDGLVVTVPYKAQVLPFVDMVAPSARLVGAVNALRRETDGSWTGDTFDGKGLVHGVVAQGHSPAGARVMLLGAGGAGSAVAFAVADAGASALTIFDADAKRAADLAERVGAAYAGCDTRAGTPTVHDVDVLINATPIGMAPDDGMPFAFGAFDPGLLVVDVVLRPEATPLLAHARACGCPTVEGRHMLEGQVAEILRFWEEESTP